MSQFNYPKTEIGNLLRNGFANRKRSETLAGDKQLASNNPLDSYKALSDGNYKGLEGIQYGTAGGLPAAMMPDGHVVLISEGEMIAGVQQREKRRRQMVETMAGDIDRREFGKKYQANFDNALASTELDQQTVGLLQARYEADPGSAITFLTNYKIDDERELARMRKDLAKEEQSRIAEVRSARATGTAKMLLASNVGTPDQIASFQSAAALIPSHVARMGNVGADATDFYVENDSALTELSTLSSLLNRGGFKAARDAFAQSNSTDAFKTTPEFAQLRDSLTGLASQIGVNFDAETVGLAMVARDTFGPDARSMPIFQALKAEIQASQTTGFKVPDNIPEYDAVERNPEDYTPEQRLEATKSDMRFKLDAAARYFMGKQGGANPAETMVNIRVLLQAVKDGNTTATSIATEVLGGVDAMKTAEKFLASGELPATFSRNVQDQDRLEQKTASSQQDMGRSGMAVTTTGRASSRGPG